MQNSEPCYIIAEIGANHNGDMTLAHEMIIAAADSGANAVKFQSWTPESLISQEEYERNASYSDTKKHFGTLREMVQSYALSESQHEQLVVWSQDAHLDFISSAFSPEEVDMLVRVGSKAIKIASMDVTSPHILKAAGASGLPVILSTGMADLGEIESAVGILEQSGCRNLTLLHCVSIYPTPLESANVRNILTLSNAFNVPVGLSDHSEGPIACIVAATLGARVFEKHFTVNRALPGWDHGISEDPDGLRALRDGLDDCIKLLGSSRRMLSVDERAKRQSFRRSAVSADDLPPGHQIVSADLKFLRPGSGIAQSEVQYLLNRTLCRPVKAGSTISWEDLE